MDAARYAGLSPFYVGEIIRSGELPALKLCRHYTILREDLDAFLDRKRRELLGANGTGWQESDAVPERGPLYRKRGGWEGELLRQGLTSDKIAAPTEAPVSRIL